MIAGSSPLEQISKALQHHAYQVCPVRRRKWIVAAVSELDAVTTSCERIAWSVGTVRAAYVARLSAMSICEPMVPKCILMLEAAFCFVSPTLLWIWALASAVRGSLAQFDCLYAAMAVSIGPIGLAIFGQLVLGTPPRYARGQARFMALLAGFGLIVVLIPVLTPIPLKDLPWRDSVLLLLLPTAGAAHYSFLARRSEAGGSSIGAVPL